jgi:DNA-binding response OmpR family regulator
MKSAILVIDLAAHRVWLGDNEIPLSPLEYEFIAYLARHAGQIVS